MVSMPPFFRPLWQLLLKTAVTDNDAPLTCADCFSILEYLLDISPQFVDWAVLIKKARQHLAACPDCQMYYQERLDKIEEMMNEG